MDPQIITKFPYPVKLILGVYKYMKIEAINNIKIKVLWRLLIEEDIDKLMQFNELIKEEITKFL
jgi:hypothetical protein